MSEEELEIEEHEEERDAMVELEPVEPLDREGLRQAIYAMLFASDRPLSVSRFAEALGDIDKEIVGNLIEELIADIEASSVPFSVKEIAGGYQLVTKSVYAPYIRRLFELKKSRRLSRAILETLAIIAYKQPVTRAEVEAIRGVSVSHAFETLLEKRLIKISGVAEVPGRPKLYRTTDEFLVQFGMKSIKELPTPDEIRQMS